jgi:hypothetical protein
VLLITQIEIKKPIGESLNKKTKGVDMTKEEIRQEIIELDGSRKMLQEVMDELHTKLMDVTKKMFALHRMLNEMKDGEENDCK